jgi:AcrR family transcriptional regulator
MNSIFAIDDFKNNLYYKSERNVRLYRKGDIMAQFKKDEVQERIHTAALTVFAEQGYSNTKIADIAVQAGVSVGNIYRYYPGKEQIFEAVMPKSFIESFKNELSRKIEEFPSQSLLSGKPFLQLLIENRERIIILFTGSQGTSYENFRKDLVGFLMAAVQQHYPELCRNLMETYRNEWILESIYAMLIDLFATIAKRVTNGAQLELALKAVNTYHLLGIAGLLGFESFNKKEGSVD